MNHSPDEFLVMTEPPRFPASHSPSSSCRPRQLTVFRRRRVHLPTRADTYPDPAYARPTTTIGPGHFRSHHAPVPIHCPFASEADTVRRQPTRVLWSPERGPASKRRDHISAFARLTRHRRRLSGLIQRPVHGDIPCCEVFDPRARLAFTDEFSAAAASTAAATAGSATAGGGGGATARTSSAKHGAPSRRSSSEGVAR